MEIKLQEEAALPSVSGITVLKKKGGHVKFEVDTAKLPINDAIRFLDAENLEDINISNIPLENIITEIYKAKEVQLRNVNSKFET